MRRILVVIGALACVSSASAEEPAAAPAVAGTPAAVEPAVAGTKSDATPASTVPAESDTVELASAAPGAPAAAAGTISYSAGLTMGAGVQTDEDMTSASTTLGLSASYVIDERFTAVAALAPYVEMTSRPGDNRRADFDPSGTFLQLAGTNLLSHAGTGLKLGGKFTYWLPLTYTDFLGTNPRLGALSASLGLTRKLGAFTAGVNLSGRYNMFLQSQASNDCDPAVEAEKGASCPSYPYTGSNNTRGSLSAAMTGAYRWGPWSASAQLGLTESQTFGPPESGEIWWPEVHAANNRYTFAFQLQGAYQVNDHFAVNGGLSNLGPQTSNGRDYSNFIFDERYAAVFAGVEWTN